MSEQVDALSHHAMVCLPVEVQNRIVRYAVQDILEESESQSKAVALSLSLVSRAAYNAVTRIVYKQIRVDSTKLSSEALSCKQADALADSLTTNPALALHVHELSVHLAPKTDPCCQKWFTSVTLLIRACELKALNLDADIDFCQPLPFIKTARLQVLRVLSFQTDALRFNAIHYWLAVISDAAGTLEELEIPGFVYEDDSVPLNLRLVPFCPKLRTLMCSNRGVASRHRSPEENTRRNSLYQAIINRHADTLQEIDFSAFQDDLRPISVQVATSLPKLRTVIFWYWNIEEEENQPISLLVSTQHLMDLSAFSSIRAIILLVFRHNNIKEMLQSCTLCLERCTWLPHLRELNVLVLNEALEDDLDITMSSQAATCGYYDNLKTLCTARGVTFSLGGTLPPYLDPDDTEG